MRSDPGRPEDSARASRRGVRAVIVSGLGLLVAVLCLAFVIGRVHAAWDEAAGALRSAQPGWVAASLGLAALGMVAIAVPWKAVLAILGAGATISDTVARYFVGELGKYLPGGVWPVVGRGEMLARRGVPRQVAYASVVLSLAALYLAALGIAVGIVPTAMASADGVPLALWLLLLLPVGVVALHPRIVTPVVALLERLTRREIGLPVPAWGTLLRLVVSYVPAWILIGSATWALARAVGEDAPWARICATTALSWAAGFLIAPVPGGVGVREAVFVAADPGMSDGLAAVVAVMARLVFVVVDVGGAAIAALSGLLRAPSSTERASTRRPHRDGPPLEP